MKMHDPFDDLRRYARDLEREIPLEHARVRVSRVMAATAATTRRPRRAVVAAAAAAFMGLSNVALASVADPAVPGDVLYPLDRAYEQVGSVVGIGGDHVLERLDEADVLVERGEAAAALSLVQEALTEIADSEDTDQARQRLTELIEQSPVLEEHLNDQVEDLLGTVHGITGPNRDGPPESPPGEDVSDAARDLNPVDPPGSPGSADENADPPNDPLAGPPEEVPGRGDPSP